MALALIVSQTPWFRDWIRRTIVREAKQYLNGELTIGRLGGNLFFGVTLSDVAVDVSGDRVVAVKALEVDYSIFHLVSRGIVLDRIALTGRWCGCARRDAAGTWRSWSRRSGAKPIAKDPAGRCRCRRLRSPTARVAIDDRVGSTVVPRCRERIDELNVEAGFAYAPVHFSIDARER